MKTIGIKLADGSFYSILKEGQISKKNLGLTTVKDNQTRILVDLYRSETGTMEDAEYVDTLQIDNLLPHPNGSREIPLNIGLDGNGHLSAEITDPETGATSNASITLVSRTLEERLEPANYDIVENQSENNSAFTEEDFSLPEFDTQVLEDPADNFENTQTPDTEEEQNEEANISEGIAGGFLAAAAVANMQNKTSDKNISEEKEYPENNDFSDDANPFDANPFDANPFDTNPNEDETSLSDIDFDLPDFQDNQDLENSEISETENTETNFMEETNNFESDINLDEPVLEEKESFEDSNFLDDTNPSDESSNQEEEDRESNTAAGLAVGAAAGGLLAAAALASKKSSEETELSNETILSNEDINTEDNNSLDDIDFDLPDINETETSGTDTVLDTEKSDENSETESYSFANDINSSESTFEDTDNNPFDSDLDDTVAEDDITIDGENSEEAIDFELPHFNDSEDSNSDIDTEINDSLLEDNSDDLFFDSLEEDTEKSYSANTAQNGGLNFDGLYDKETVEGNSSIEDESTIIKQKTKTPVIICIVCAIICIIATLLVLFIIPSKYNLLQKENTEVLIEKEELSPVQEKPQELLPLEPKEDEIIVAKEPEQVIPAPAPEPEVKPTEITYKIKWGDTLWDIANAYYKNPWQYHMIAKHNGIRNPDYIISGTIIKLPVK